MRTDGGFACINSISLLPICNYNFDEKRDGDNSMELPRETTIRPWLCIAGSLVAVD